MKRYYLELMGVIVTIVLFFFLSALMEKAQADTFDLSQEEDIKVALTMSLICENVAERVGMPERPYRTVSVTLVQQASYMGLQPQSEAFNQSIQARIRNGSSLIHSDYNGNYSAIYYDFCLPFKDIIVSDLYQ